MKNPRLLHMLLAAAIVMASVCAAHADDFDAELEAMLAEAVESPVYEYPNIPATYSFGLGAALAGDDLATGAGRYSYSEGSGLSYGFQTRGFPFPHRFYLLRDHRGPDDNYTDLRYAYGDTVFLRWLGVAVHHNLEYEPLGADDTLTPSPSVNVLDAPGGQHVTVALNDVYLRLKYPGYAAHVFMRYWERSREGMKQQRVLLGSGYFNDLRKTSQDVEVDWKSTDLTVGANAHLGHMEVEASHGVNDFTSGNAATFDSYTANSFRSAGTYSHSAMPELESSEDILMAHTSYTGRLVMAATMSARESDNKTSGAKVKYGTTTASMSIIFNPSNTLYLLYSKHTMDADNPGAATVADALNPANTYTYSVRQPVSADTSRTTLAYQSLLTGSLTVRAKYSTLKASRENSQAWGIDTPDTGTRTGQFSATLRPSMTTRVRAEFEQKRTDMPVYNNEGDVSRRGRLNVDHAFAPDLRVSAGYSTRLTERRGLDYPGTTLATERTSASDNTYLGAHFMLPGGISAMATFTKIFNAIKQDIAYASLSGQPLVAPGALYDDTSHCYAIDLSMPASERFTLAAGLTFTTSSASFRTNNSDLTLPVDVSTLSEVDIRQTDYRLSGTYSFGGGLDLSADLAFSNLDDMTADANPDALQDGNSYKGYVRVTKAW